MAACHEHDIKSTTGEHAGKTSNPVADDQVSRIIGIGNRDCGVAAAVLVAITVPSVFKKRKRPVGPRIHTQLYRIDALGGIHYFRSHGKDSAGPGVNRYDR